MLRVYWICWMCYHKAKRQGLQAVSSWSWNCVFLWHNEKWGPCVYGVWDFLCFFFHLLPPSCRFSLPGWLPLCSWSLLLLEANIYHMDCISNRFGIILLYVFGLHPALAAPFVYSDKTLCWISLSLCPPSGSPGFGLLNLLFLVICDRFSAVEFFTGRVQWILNSFGYKLQTEDRRRKWTKTVGEPLQLTGWSTQPIYKKAESLQQEHRFSSSPKRLLHSVPTHSLFSCIPIQLSRIYLKYISIDRNL